MDPNTEQNAPVDGAPEEARYDNEFDAALAELHADETAPADKAAAQEPSEQDDKGADDTSAPADKAAVPDDAADADRSPAETPTDDIWANAPLELREAHERDVRDRDLRYRSLQGRQTTLDREIDRLRQSVQQQPGRQDNQDQQTQEGDKGKTPETDDLAKLQEDYPEIAGPLVNLIRKQNEQLEKLGQSTQAFEQSRVQQAVQVQESLLAEQHSDWQQVAADERFQGWLQDQPQALQDAMARNYHAIVDGKDAALVVGKFKSDMGIGTASAPTPTPTPAPSDKRQRQIANNRDAGRGGAPVTTGIPENDFDASLEYFGAQP